MKSADCILLSNPDATPTADPMFWRDGQKRLILLFEALNEAGDASVLGIDPDAPRLVFRAPLVLADQKPWFIEAVQGGREPTTPDKDTLNGTTVADYAVKTNAVVIPDPDDPPKGPKCLLPPA